MAWRVDNTDRLIAKGQFVIVPHGEGLNGSGSLNGEASKSQTVSRCLPQQPHVVLVQLADNVEPTADIGHSTDMVVMGVSQQKIT